MEGVSRRYPLYLSGEPGAGQHFLVVVDLLHCIPMRTVVNAFLRCVMLRGVGFIFAIYPYPAEIWYDTPKISIVDTILHHCRSLLAKDQMKILWDTPFKQYLKAVSCLVSLSASSVVSNRPPENVYTVTKATFSKIYSLQTYIIVIVHCRKIGS